jgi:hypothetical protein
VIEVQARRATAADAEELVRLRMVMFESVDGVAPEPGQWSQEAVRSLRERLPGPDARTAAFVVDRPGEPGRLSACAVGVIDARLGSPSNPTGLHGYVFNVATDDRPVCTVTSSTSPPTTDTGAVASRGRA